MRNDRLQDSKLVEASQYVRNLEVGNHGIFFYRNPAEKHEVLFNFLQAGLEKGERAIYVAAQETSKQICKHMEDFGLDIKALYRDGSLRILDYDDWYIIDGEVDIPRLQARGQRVFQEAMEMGLKGLRGCGEAACFFEHQKVKELVDYELMIGRKFDLPLTALCAYDVNHTQSLEDTLFFSLIKAHGSVVTAGFAHEVTFEHIFPTILDQVLENVFGDMGKQAILRMLRERYSLTPRKIAENPKSSIEQLEELVNSGAEAITKWVATEMRSRMGIARKKHT